jgi:hypothetical protein
MSTGTVLLRTSTGKVVPAAVSFNSSTHTVTLNPTPNLGHRARYTVTLIGGAAAIRDGAGNPLATRIWSFTTS